MDLDGLNLEQLMNLFSLLVTLKNASNQGPVAEDLKGADGTE